MELFSGYDNMMLGQADTEINEPITSQGCEMPSPYESQEVEEETFETLKAGGGIFDGMGAGEAVSVAGLLGQIKALRAKQVEVIKAGGEASPQEFEIIRSIDALKAQIQGAPLSPEEQKLANEAMGAAEALALQAPRAARYSSSSVLGKQWIKGVPNVAVIAGVAAIAAYFLLRKKG
jgi:hypothetical protein